MMPAGLAVIRSAEEKIMIKSLTPRKWPLRQIAAWILMIGLLAACASGPEARENLGTLKLSREVSQIFENYQVLSNYKYYFTGSQTKPLAIMGIDRKYTLVSRIWKEAADLTPEQLKRWVDQILEFLPPMRTYGAHILGADGQQVGIWYSPYDETTVRMLADNQIEVVPPSYARKPRQPKGFKGFGIGIGF
jgi:hypothetical protein